MVLQCPSNLPPALPGESMDHIQPSVPRLHGTTTPTRLRARAAKAELELKGHLESREDSSSLISGAGFDGCVEE